MFKEKKVIISYSLLGILLILCIISCLAIYSATPLITKIDDPSTTWLKQLVFFGLSFFLMFIVYLFGNERIYRLCWVFYGILMVLLIGLAVQHILTTRFGMGRIIPLAKTAGGATSWYAFPMLDLQPSEFMKIILVICLARVISKHNTEYPVHRFYSDCIMLGKILLVSLPPCILIYLQNDSGVTMIILVSIVFMIFVSGIQARWFVAGGIVLIAGIATLAYIFVEQPQLFSELMGGGHKVSRFYGWLNPEGTFQGEGYQLFSAMIAYGTGGMFGHGIQSNVFFFPEAHTDFIFAVISQDFGFVGGLVTIIAIVIFDVILIRIGLKSLQDHDKYYVAGIIGLLVFQQIWNIGMVLGLVPITGITLPIISYGGSSLLSYMIAMGIFLDMDKQTKIIASKEHFHA